MMRDVFLAFIPVFVAVDAIGVLPIFVALTDSMGTKERLGIILKSLTMAFCLAIGFIFLGRAIFKILNITVADFMIAGGTLLFCIAIIDLLNPTKKRRMPSDEMGFVPLGTPLIVGPAVLTTSLLMMDAHGLMPTLIAVLVNIAIAGAVFASAGIFIRAIGVAGTKAMSKITSLLLAAIAVMMIRKGIMFFIAP